MKAETDNVVGVWVLDNTKWPNTVVLQFTAQAGFGIGICATEVGGSYRVVGNRVFLSPEIVTGGRVCSPLELDQTAVETYLAMRQAGLSSLTLWREDSDRLILRDDAGRSLTFRRAK